MTQYSFTEKKRIRKSFRQARQRAAGAVPAGNPARVVPRVPAGRNRVRVAQERRPAGRLHVDIPDFQPLGQRPPGIRRLFAAAAGVRRHRMPAARPDLLLRAARQGAADPDGQGSAQGDGQGSQGAGSLHGRNPAHDRQRLVRHQRHGARHRVAAAPFAGRVLRARPRQDAFVRQAPVLGAGDSLPRLVAGLRVRSQGLPVFPRRPPPQDAGDDAAEGDRAVQRGDPEAVLRVRRVPPRQEGLAARPRARAAAGRGRAVRPRRQGRQGAGAEGQAHHRAAHPRARRRRRQEDRGAQRLHRRPHARREHRQQGNRRDHRVGQRRDHRRAADDAARRGRRDDPHDLRQRPRPGCVHRADAEDGRHARPDGGADRDLPDDASRRAADRRSRRGAVPRPVLQRRALRPVAGRPHEVQSPRRPQRADRPGHADQRRHHRGHQDPGRAAQRPRRDRRHRPPRQPARALGGRTRGEPVPFGPRARRARGQGTPRPGRERKPAAARPDQRQADLGRDQGVLRQLAAVAVHGPDQPAVGDHAQAARVGAGTRAASPASAPASKCATCIRRTTAACARSRRRKARTSA